MVTQVASTFKAEDTIGGSIDSLDKGLRCYMSYVDNYRGFDELVMKRGGAGVLLVPITVNNNRAKCADFESGGMVAEQAPGWLDHLAEPDPWLYTFASNAQNVYNYAGRRKYAKWQAHTGQGEHLCGRAGRGWPGNPGCQYPDADITQWVFSPGGRNIDISTGLTYLLPGPPTPKDPYDYLIFANDVWLTPYGRLRELDVVLHYDGARKHYRRPWTKRLVNNDLRPKLHWLADRVRAEAYRHPVVTGQGQDAVRSPGWLEFSRGERYQLLRGRADNRQYVR